MGLMFAEKVGGTMGGSGDSEEALKQLRPPPIVLDDDIEGTEYEIGAAVQLTGLQAYPHLNGCMARVVSYLPDRRRYEISLLSGGTQKAVNSRNLLTLPLVEEATLWRDELSKPSLSAEEASRAVARLHTLPVTVDVLQQTRIGKVVAETSKRFADDDVAKAGRHLVQRWREMYQRVQSLDRLHSGVAVQEQPQLQPPLLQPLQAQPSLQLQPQGQMFQPPQQPEAAVTNVSLQETTPGPATAHGTIPIPTESRGGVGDATSVNAVSEKSIESPITRPEEALQLVNAMRNATSDRVRLSTLAALETANPVHLPFFVTAGGLAVLDKWLRTRSECRSSVLAMLEKIPVTSHDVAEARLCGAVITVSRNDVSPARHAAVELLDRWRRAGVITETEWRAPTVEVPSAGSKRPRVEECSPERAAPMAPALAAPAPVRPTIVLPKNCPPEVAKLDPRIAKVLLETPVLLEFLSKHRSIMHNLNAENIGFLSRNLRNSKGTQLASASEDHVINRSITLTNLHPEVIEGDIMTLMDENGFGPAEVTLPRESRKQRSCCVATVVLPTRDAARVAVRELQGSVLRGRGIRVEPADRATSSPSRGSSMVDDAGKAKASGRRIAWRTDEELWEVALFDRFESVNHFKGRLDSSDTTSVGVETSPAEASARFLAAVKHEHAAERKLVREALAGEMAAPV